MARGLEFKSLGCKVCPIYKDIQTLLGFLGNLIFLITRPLDQIRAIRICQGYSYISYEQFFVVITGGARESVDIGLRPLGRARQSGVASWVVREQQPIGAICTILPRRLVRASYPVDLISGPHDVSRDRLTTLWTRSHTPN